VGINKLDTGGRVNDHGSQVFSMNSTPRILVPGLAYKRSLIGAIVVSLLFCLWAGLVLANAFGLNRWESAIHTLALLSAVALLWKHYGDYDDMEVCEGGLKVNRDFVPFGSMKGVKVRMRRLGRPMTLRIVYVLGGKWRRAQFMLPDAIPGQKPFDIPMLAAELREAAGLPSAAPWIRAATNEFGP
jgi:hypothetical protein